VPPPRKLSFAAFTIASTASVVMSPTRSSNAVMTSSLLPSQREK
jgi:hypothetical protein